MTTIYNEMISKQDCLPI